VSNRLRVLGIRGLEVLTFRLYRPTRWSAETERAIERSNESAVAMTAVAETSSDKRVGATIVHGRTGFDVEFERPNAFPPDAFDRPFLLDISIPPQFHTAVLVRSNER
jgi:hypothetical protein